MWEVVARSLKMNDDGMVCWDAGMGQNVMWTQPRSKVSDVDAFGGGRGKEVSQ
jgi:hypothetical protein